MWPQSGLEIVKVCAGVCAAPGLSQLRIAGVQADGTRPERDELFFALREPAYDFDGHDWVLPYLRAGAALAVVAADWPLYSALPKELQQRCIVVQDSLRALRNLAARLRQRFTFPLIAVGGSNGKTTTKEMLAALLSAPGSRVTRTQGNLNGYTGIPLTLTQRTHAAAAPPQALVVEVGIDGPRAMAEHAALLDPEVAVLTALGPEHLLGFSTWETAAAEELLLFEASPKTRRIFQARDVKLRERLTTARRGDIIVCDEDDAATCDKHVRHGVSLLTFRVSFPAALTSEVELTFHPAATEQNGAAPVWRGRLHVPMPGRHNADNLAAAFGAALAIGRSPDALLRGWSSFQPPALRCQTIALPGDGILIDDTYNASPLSMAAALALLDSPALRTRRKLLFLGDMLELGAFSAEYHRALCEPLRKLPNAQLYLFGDAMHEVHRVLSKQLSSTVFLPSQADPRDFFAHAAIDFSGAVVLVKGSRAMRLDRVACEIRRAAGLPSDSENALLHGPIGGRWQLQFSDEQ